VTRTPKVYNGCFFLNGKQVRGVMAGTQCQIAEATHTHLSYIRDYWSETGNTEAIEAARTHAGNLLWIPLNFYNAQANDYRLAKS
jgi:hypothetical protein